MWPTWGPPGSCRPQVGPMLAPWTWYQGGLRQIRNAYYKTRRSEHDIILRPIHHWMDSTLLGPQFENSNTSAPAHYLAHVFCPWVIPYWEIRRMTMTLHNCCSRQFNRTLNGENPPDSFTFMGSAKPPGPHWHQIWQVFGPCESRCKAWTYGYSGFHMAMPGFVKMNSWAQKCYFSSDACRGISTQNNGYIWILYWHVHFTIQRSKQLPIDIALGSVRVYGWLEFAMDPYHWQSVCNENISFQTQIFNVVCISVCIRSAPVEL